MQAEISAGCCRWNKGPKHFHVCFIGNFSVDAAWQISGEILLVLNSWYLCDDQ